MSQLLDWFFVGGPLMYVIAVLDVIAAILLVVVISQKNKPNGIPTTCVVIFIMSFGQLAVGTYGAYLSKAEMELALQGLGNTTDYESLYDAAMMSVKRLLYFGVGSCALFLLAGLACLFTQKAGRSA